MTTGPGPLPAPPPYGRGTLAELMPSVVAATRGTDAALAMPHVARHCVLLVDGLGSRSLAARTGHAPFLRTLLPGTTISAGFPSTTATSMGMLGTGLPPGAHGLVGLEVLDPARDRLVNQLSWDRDVDPRQWQPFPTVFGEADADGTDVVRIGPAFFDGSGLTEATLRGGRFVAAEQLAARVDAAVAVLRDAAARRRSCIVYVYWGELDKTGHVHGTGSVQWTAELEAVDAAAARLADALPPGSALHVVADHGMVDVDPSARIDLAHSADLARGVRHVAGEARAVQLHCVPGARDDVLACWRESLGASTWVLTRAEAVTSGLFGEVSERVLPRIGDILAVAASAVSVVDSRTQRPELVNLLGLHGALTPDEMEVPLLTVAT